MAWNQFPHPDDAYVYTDASLRAAWPRLHVGDAEAFPEHPVLLRAWIAFHAGDFELAARLGLDLGVAGYSVAHKAACVHATYLEKSEKKRIAAFEEVAERCERHQLEQPGNAAAFYWHAYALGRYALGTSVIKALARGVGAAVKRSLDTTLALAPQHADAHLVLGAYHAEIVDKVGAMIGGMTYGVRKDAGYQHFQRGLALHPESAVGHSEYAHALLMLDGKKKMDEALAMSRAAVACTPRDAMERLQLEKARQQLQTLLKDGTRI